MFCPALLDLRPVMAGPLSKAGLVGFGLGLSASSPRPRLFPLTTLWQGWWARQMAQEARERRFFLWLPVCFLIGVLGYFAALREPSPSAALAGLVTCGLLAFFAQRRGALRLAWFLCAGAFLFAGLSAAVWRSASVAAPVLASAKVTKVTAYIESVDERRGGGGRLLLRVGEVDGLAREATPQKLRVTIRVLGGLQAGETIRATMRLIPPAEPSEPGGYDFAREAYFQSIGGVGNIVSRVEMAEPLAVPPLTHVNAAIDRARNDLTRRIAQVIGGDDGAVAAALVTGKRGLISEDANEALRGAGIYHVVSISGLHMVLAAGLFMWSLRAFLSLFPAVALNYPVKKIAAAFAMLGATAYCIFAGSEVATERSLIMILVMLGAVLVDRPALSMRNLGVAALIVMIREPESVMGPSFQMSFGAVAAMVALFEKNPQDEAREFDPTFLHRTLRAFGIMLLTTFIAGLATGPFSSFHFHRINPYSMIGNALTLPLVEFIVMPAALLGVVLGPLGLDAWVWQFMGMGISGMMDVSRVVAAFHGSTRYVETFGFIALLIIALGLLFLCLWRSQIRWLGVPLILGGLWLAQNDSPADLAVDARARSMAVRGFSGKFEVLNGKGNDFAVSQWLLADADARKPNAPDLKGLSQCDTAGCITYLEDGRVVAFITEPHAIAEDCARADVVITRLYVGTRCKGPEIVLDGAHFAAHGATELRLRADGTWAKRVARVEGAERPWYPQRQARFTRAPVIASGEAQDEADDPRLFSPE